MKEQRAPNKATSLEQQAFVIKTHHARPEASKPDSVAIKVAPCKTRVTHQTLAPRVLFCFLIRNDIEECKFIICQAAEDGSVSGRDTVVSPFSQKVLKFKLSACVLWCGWGIHLAILNAALFGNLLKKKNKTKQTHS